MTLTWTWFKAISEEDVEAPVGVEGACHDFWSKECRGTELLNAPGQCDLLPGGWDRAQMKALGSSGYCSMPYGSIWNILNRRQIECKLNATCSNLIATTFWSFRHSWTTLRMLSTRNPSECSECDAWCDVQPICVYFLQALVIFVLEQLVCNWQKGGSPSGLGKTQRLHKRTYKIL